ncbi:aspartate kinase [Erysipelothrix urinaevulpis]|uniref:aspartate kinase n=1 Tax=Erysipelothrix urinaevulpis TaxID=2683717 RepID=UPI001359067E|nr:aspartate kinase [Erysipelothrix urinaevulpis]
MTHIVMKFGGSSLADTQKIKEVARLIIERKKETKNVVVVVSAMGKTTNQLIEMANEISLLPNKREMDVLLASGEQVSISLLSMALHSLDQESISLTGWQAGIKTYGNSMKQRIKDIDTSRISQEHQRGKIVIVAGFQGYDEDDNISTLGRGGSDTSAVALAVALNCPCEIYTDVDGIYTADPRIVKNAKVISRISYEECMEMASLGAKVIEARAVDLGSRFGIPIKIALNTGQGQGTIIEKGKKDMLEENVINNVSVLDNVVLFNVNNFGKEPRQVLKLFEYFANNDINIDVISQNFNDDISFTSKKEDLEDVKTVISKFTDHKYQYKDDVIKVSVIGNGMRYQSGVAAKVYEVFTNEDVKFYQVSTSEISISYIVDQCNKEKIVTALAKTFDLEKGDHHEY